MLELRLTTDAKRIASMRESVRRECGRSNVGPEHGETVASIVEQLIVVGSEEPGRRLLPRRERRREVLVIVTVQSDATMVMVREHRPDSGDLGRRRQQLLDAHALRWSTMSGADGRTIWAEIARPPKPTEPRPERDPVARAEPAAHARLGAIAASRAVRALPCAP